MAYLAQLGALADELVAALTSIPEAQRERRDAYREFVLRSLRHHTFTRTNQFEVQDRLDGLEERFCVVGRDALARALRIRLDALESHRSQTTPEVLHLLLELADQPAQKSNLSDLDALVEPEEDAPPPLTWRDIAREDGWKQERDIWRFVDYSLGSSDEDEVDVLSEASLESLTTTSSAEGKSQPTVEALASIEPLGGEVLKQVQAAQAWRHDSAAAADGRPKRIPISTTQLLREVLFMLADLETNLFDAGCNPMPKYQLRGVSLDSYKALLTSFAECGRKLAPLRAFAKQREKIPLLQVFQDCVQKALHSLDLELSQIQARMIANKDDVVISLTGVLEELGPTLTPLYSLADIVRQLQEERNSHAFRCLELLYDAVGMAQLQGSRSVYQLLGTIFFDCFQVYLKPIRLWMEEGKLLPGDRTFFVSESPTKLPLPQIWKSQFNLLRTPEGSLHAPRFLKPAIHRIFTAGKSIVVLKHMKQHESTRKYRPGAEPKMDFAMVCPDEAELAPFSELFSAAFHAWIRSKHHSAAAMLRELLFRSYGLSEDLDALQRIYLMSDGARFDTFASSVFRHLDGYSSSWKDRFTLTEIAQEAFSGCIDGDRLSAEVEPRGLAHSGLASRSSVRLSLPAIRLRYRLSWPVQIVVPDDGIQGYQTIFTFLLQARRAISVLQHPILTPQPAGPADRASYPYYLLRSKLLWFGNTVTTYLATLVLAPNAARLRADLRSAADVDDMVAAHAAFVARLVAESCQGAKLQPIRDCILDVFDLAIRLEDAQRAETARREEEDAEISRLSVMSSPYKSPAPGRDRAKRRRVESEDDEGEEEDGAAQVVGEWMVKRHGGKDSKKPYALVLRELHGDFERHLRFIASGLRGVARASREEAAAKWDLLAEMLEVGIKD
ncbi:0402ed36-62da-4221-8860-2e149c75dff2 [Thermothielavioides terrestris]|uniref:Spindle pole body component n=1 Tax=Thermothielavioides terrestris TaxID=2587410 RepID=A0A446BH36_9PEZI|nr:0402ed36-62da-4221-8860-2e149c75dff2 [Thermothielavioides terrestris]